MIVYLAGPMSHRPDFNRPAFHAAALALRCRGYHVVSPAENQIQGASWETYIRSGLLMLLTRCDAIAFLPDWHTSRGAVLEYEVAHALQYPIFDVVDGDLVKRT